MNKPKINRQLLTPNKYSRPASKLISVRKLVIHYVENPLTTAMQNRDFFELRKNGQFGYGSAHYIVDETTIIQCIPDDERAYHVGSDTYTDYGLSISSYPNARTLGIEMCHYDETGRPKLQTYYNTLDLCAYICKKYKLDPLEDICLHYDITGRDEDYCHKYYLDVPSEFYRLKVDVKNRMVNNDNR